MFNGVLDIFSFSVSVGSLLMCDLLWGCLKPMEACHVLVLKYIIVVIGDSQTRNRWLKHFDVLLLLFCVVISVASTFCALR